MSELLWIAVPGGVLTGDQGSEALLRALVVPRLGGRPDGTTLEGYGLRDWPALLAGATIRARVSSVPSSEPGTPIEARVDAAVRDGLWQAMFPAGLAVRAFRPRSGYPTPRVEASATQAGTLQRLYTQAASTLADPRTRAPARSVDLGEAPPQAPLGAEVTEPTPERPDFHRVVTMLREHPAVLEALGLVVTLHVPRAALEASSLVQVTCELTGGPDDLDCVSPWTAYRIAAGRFLAAPDPNDPSDLADGMVRLDETAWTFATFDVAGAVDRLREAARRELEDPQTAPAALPALRSSGLNLLRADRLGQFVRRSSRGNANSRRQSMLGMVLHADDLVLGYRVDVRTTDETWRSLMHRRATYGAVAGGPAVDRGSEEGHVKALAMTVEDRGGPRPGLDPDGVDRRPFVADEVVVRWDGWSLSAARPSLPASDRPPRTELPFLRWTFQPFGVPHLRFGETYRMRLRVADAAGGGLTIEQPEITEGESNEVFYGRHDPVPPPFLVVPPDSTPTGLGPGGDVDTLVIRSDPATGRGVAAFTAAFPRNDRRTLLPPPSPFVLAEHHGRLDGVDDARGADLLRRAMQPPAVLPGTRHSWLPDPMAEGVAITVGEGPGEPEDPGEREGTREAWTVPSGTWPDFDAKELVLTDRPAGDRLDVVDGGRRLVARLAAGEQIVLEVSSSIREEIQQLAMHNWLDPSVGVLEVSPALLALIVQRVREGRHPMVSPSRTMHLIHATQHPRDNPAGTLAAARTPSATFALLVPPEDNALLGLHAASTGQVELAAAWDEVEDADPSPENPRPATVPRPIRTQVHLARVDPGATMLPQLRHEFADTKHRRVTYTLSATSRYRDCFPEGTDTSSVVPLVQTIDVPSAAAPPPPVVLAVTPALSFRGTDLPPGWTDLARTRRGGLVRVELARPWFATGAGERLGVVVDGGGGAPPRLVATARRDPIFGTPLPPGSPDAAMFAGADGPVADLLLADGAGAQVPVRVVPYGVERSSDPDVEDHWFAELDLSALAAASYLPFVQLALVRYQPESLPGLHLSALVRAEPVQLLPERTLGVSRSAGTVSVRLDGLEPEFTEDVELGRRPGHRRPRVLVHLERLPAGAGRTDVTATRADLGAGWQRVDTVAGRLGSMLTVAVPDGPEPVRLVVREAQPFFGSANATTPVEELAERTTLLDVIPLR